LVAGALISITAHALEKRDRRVYHMASGDVNPFVATRSVELVGLYRRRFYRNKAQNAEQNRGNKFWNEMLARIEPQPISWKAFHQRSAPLFERGAKKLREVIDDVKPTWGAPQISALLSHAQDKLTEVEEQASSLNMLVDLFFPFIFENRYVFRCDNTRSVSDRLVPYDQERIPWDPEKLDWRTYFLEVHLPGLEKWVFPGLEEETSRRKVIPAYRDLVEMFEASTHAFRHRVAFRRVADEKEDRFTYGEVHRYASRVAAFLLRSGLKKGDRVLLVSENRPEWGMSYFGIILAGGTAVPVDPELSEAEVVNIAKRAKASSCLISEEAIESLPGLHRAFAEASTNTQTHSLAQAMEGDSTHTDRIGVLKRSVSPDDLASLIFTSGTTGNPKGVMLTHRNFTALVAKLAGAFDIGVGDGLLSVLPMHHTFEFSCGFLLPFSRGAEVSYIDELTSDRLGEVFETGRVTAMIGVPALWQLLHRKITQELAARPAFVEQGIKALMAANAELRNRSPLNLGKLLFWPVHRKFGGKMKFLVSGGSALPDEVHKAFHALGFNISEGYGLTEAAPVLSVSETTNKREPGTVGRALPGIEFKIVNADQDGIGEVIAKGPNVMAGYFEDRDATAAAIKEGWLYTGDLGRLDADNKLYLVGRQKDVIIDANGKNVFPDELEEIYARHAHIEELSIVGLPDEAGGEKVACLCVPNYKERPREEVRREIEEHFKKISADMPFYRRVKILRVWDGELPRTSTRKVKRKLVVEELKKLDRVAASGEKAKTAVTASTGGVSDWLYPLLADVLQRPLSDIRPEATLLAELGLDSLMLTELSVALDNAGVRLPPIADLAQVETVDDLRKLVASTGRKPAAELRAREISRENEDRSQRDIPVPEVIATMGRGILSAGQKWLYGSVFDVKVSGKSFIPQNRNFLVVANHSSHLDMGLIKTVLGDQGERLTALAARDYFFDTPIKRAYFENFTNLIPMDREGSLRESLRLAGEALNQGYNLLIFPEGTRSLSGDLLEFKATLGFLALTYQVDVLPLFLEGTYEALPKGSLFPKATDLKVRIGPALMYRDLKALAAGMARSEGYRRVTKVVEEAVTALRDHKVLNLNEPPRPPKPALPLPAADKSASAVSDVKRGMQGGAQHPPARRPIVGDKADPAHQAVTPQKSPKRSEPPQITKPKASRGGKS
ncbi:MAG: AMP-binding protein, partial [Myxococcaceae bacterium]